MREIKFRAWTNNCYIQSGMLYDYHNTIYVENFGFNDEDLPVMQYTGLKDKNGVEIYEGDVLYTEFEKSRYLNEFSMYTKKWKHVVEYVGQGFNIPNIEGVFRQSMCTAIYNQDKPTPEWEVIGNIYENPELNENTTS